MPVIVIGNLKKKNNFFGEFVDKLNMPFGILDLQKKIISLFARYEFFQSSLINLCGYVINKNERKIKKNNLELQLTEKEINFLILFSKNNKPLSKNFILKKVWKYSIESNTHTVESQIHRNYQLFHEIVLRVELHNYHRIHVILVSHNLPSIMIHIIFYRKLISR